MKIPFNKPWFTGKEIQNISSAAAFGHISGNGIYTKKCHQFFHNRYRFDNCFLTTSCTDALEMATLLMDITPGDEIIMPSYTFVSTTSPFILRGAKIVFADSMTDHPNIDIDSVENLITKSTKALMVMHYGGVAVDMDKAVSICKKHNLVLIEDVAHAIDSYYNNKPLGSFGDFSIFSFHETKNISSGEGGMLVVNTSEYVKRAEIIWEKGTNRSAFTRGDVSKYEWVDVGASYTPSEIIAAFLYAQLNHIDDIQNKRIKLWERYYNKLKPLENKGIIKLPAIPDFATNNGHVFYLITRNLQERNALLQYLNENKVQAVFHYLTLHNSPYYNDKHDGRTLASADNFANTLIRLPLFYELSVEAVDMISDIVISYYS